MENYSDQSYTVHVELDAHKVSIAVAVAFYSSRTNAVELIDYVSVCDPKIAHYHRPSSRKCSPSM